MADLSGPTTIRRTLGRKLKALRLAAGKTQMDVETARVTSRSTLNRIESGTRATRVGEVLELCRFYRIRDAETLESLASLAERTDAEGWWGEYGVSPWFSMYLDLELAADELLVYDPNLVHGLLQTPDYARALFEASNPDPAIVNRQLDLRRQRQEAVARREEPLRITAVFGASALEQLIGGADVIASQRAQLTELAEQPHLDIRVIPREVGAHPSSHLPAFTIIAFNEPDDPDVVYQESLTGARYAEVKEEVEQHRSNFSRSRDVSIPVKEFA